MNKSTFNKINEFSYHYTMGESFDDNDFLLKIIANNIDISNMQYDKINAGGIHLFHELSNIEFTYAKNSNESLYRYKENIYIDIYDKYI